MALSGSLGDLHIRRLQAIHARQAALSIADCATDVDDGLGNAVAGVDYLDGGEGLDAGNAKMAAYKVAQRIKRAYMKSRGSKMISQSKGCMLSKEGSRQSPPQG